MAVTITLAQVRARYPSLSTVADDTITDLIAYADLLDDCLDSSYPGNNSLQTLIKLALVAHLASLNTDARVSSRRAPNGASVSYDRSLSSEGLAETSYGRFLLQIDTSGCVTNLINGDSYWLVAVGGDNAPS